MEGTFTGAATSGGGGGTGWGVQGESESESDRLIAASQHGQATTIAIAQVTTLELSLQAVGSAVQCSAVQWPLHTIYPQAEELSREKSRRRAAEARAR